MNRIHIQMTTLAALLALVGCAKEFENPTDSSDSSAIELSSVSTDPMTKAVITGTEFTTSEAEAGIGLFLLDGTGATYGSNSGNVRYAHNDGKWTAASPLRIGNTEGTLVGYYPYSETSTNVKAIPVASSINGTDYLFGSIAEITSAKAKTESLTLSHALTRLKITFKLDKSFVGSGTLSSLTIEGDGIAASGTLDATTGTVTATKSAFTVSGLNASISTGLTEDCLVVPAAASNTPQAVTLKFTVDGKSYKVNLTDNLSVKLQSGIQTDITLTVKNTSVSIDGSSIGAWGEGGTQTVTVGGDYTVTISLGNGIPAHDVLTDVYVDGNSVIVKAYSSSGQHLKCTMPDGEFCTSQSKTSNLVYTFTISDISENTTATIGYASPVSIAVGPENSGSVEIIGDPYEGETVTLKAVPGHAYGFDAWLDKAGNPLTCEEESYSSPVRLSLGGMSVRFKANLILGGEFSVAASKKVRFTRGNLYCSGAKFNDDGKCTSVTNAQWRLEQHQYDYGGKWDGGNRISHFLWSKDCLRSLDKTYDGTDASTQDVFFTNSGSFAVSGISSSDYEFRTLTAEEWQYLFSYDGSELGGQNYDNDARRGKYKLRVTVCGKDKCIVLLPDNWTGGTIESSYDYVGWKHMEEAGAVCLPAAGYRYGGDGDTGISGAGNVGCYWSASPLDSSHASDFNSVDVNPNHRGLRNQAFAVRLVTEVK